MILTVILLSIAGVQSSGIHQALPNNVAPVVTAASSQYFERTFNRLVAAQPIAPVIPVAPAAPAPPVIIDARSPIIPVNPTNPPQNLPGDPNIAIAIATANAAPVATFLLPPYPFGLPPSYGFIPQAQPSDNDFNREATTQTTTTFQTTTEREQEATTALPSNIDNSFAQALPSNDNINFKQYGPPLPLPGQKPQKIKTSVEVVPVPLAYIAPPPLQHHHHHHDHHHHHHQALKIVPHVHTFLPKTAKIIIRPISRPHHVRTVRVPAKYSHPHVARKSFKKFPQNIKARSRDIELTTPRPINRPATKPPRL